MRDAVVGFSIIIICDRQVPSGFQGEREREREREKEREREREKERGRERERKILRMHISHVNLWESLIGVTLHASECERRRTSHSERQFVVVGCDRLGSVLEICLK